MIDWIAIILICSGLFFFFGSVIGLVRFPDFYTRMHAAGKGDTLSTILILAGLAIYYLNHFADFDEGHWKENISIILVAIKVIGIAGFVMLTSPTSTHALMQAGYEEGIKPVGEDLEDDHEEEGQDA